MIHWITESPTIIILILIIINLSTISYSYKAWETARSLRQVIVLSPEVCEICAKVQTFKEHEPEAYFDQIHDILKGDTMAEPVILGFHQYTPAHLVYNPGTIGDAGYLMDPDTRNDIT